MADVYMRVRFADAAERTAEKRYLLRVEYDDDFIPIEAAASSLLTALNLATWDVVTSYALEVEYPQGGSPNISANNQVAAFTRIYDTGGESGSLIVPAWDDFLYDEDNNNILDPAYNTVMAAVALLTRNPETGDNWVLVPQYSQSHTRKQRQNLG